MSGKSKAEEPKIEGREFSFSELAFDEKLALEGVWCKFPDESSDFEVRISHHDRPAYDAEVQRARRHYAREIVQLRAEAGDDDLGDEDPRVTRLIQARSLSRGIVLDWRIGGPKGKHVARTPEGELPFSPDNAEMMLSRFTAFYHFVLLQTYTVSNYRKEVEEDDLKN